MFEMNNFSLVPNLQRSLLFLGEDKYLFFIKNISVLPDLALWEKLAHPKILPATYHFKTYSQTSVYDGFEGCSSAFNNNFSGNTDLRITKAKSLLGNLGKSEQQKWKGEGVVSFQDFIVVT